MEQSISGRDLINGTFDDKCLKVPARPGLVDADGIVSIHRVAEYVTQSRTALGKILKRPTISLGLEDQVQICGLSTFRSTTSKHPYDNKRACGAAPVPDSEAAHRARHMPTF